MTQAEFIRAAQFVREKGKLRLGVLAPDGMTLYAVPDQRHGRLTRPPAEILAGIHQQAVAERVAMNRRAQRPGALPYERVVHPVPAAVLKDYPGLVGQQPNPRGITPLAEQRWRKWCH